LKHFFTFVRYWFPSINLHFLQFATIPNYCSWHNYAILNSTSTQYQLSLKKYILISNCHIMHDDGVNDFAFLSNLCFSIYHTLQYHSLFSNFTVTEHITVIDGLFAYYYLLQIQFLICLFPLILQHFIVCEQQLTAFFNWIPISLHVLPHMINLSTKKELGYWRKKLRLYYMKYDGLLGSINAVILMKSLDA
jgi:hypothetical protein